MVSLRKISGFFVLCVSFAVPVWAADEPETRIYEVDTEATRVLIHVHRAGLMRRAGHDHVIASEHVSGEVEYTPDRDSSAKLRVPLADLVVDAPAYRERFDLDPEVSESSIRGTRRNMLEKVLDPETYPDVRVTVAAENLEATRPALTVTIGLQGAESVYDVPVDLTIDAESLEVSGNFTILHTDFGMRPFRAAAGLLRVADEIDIHFELVANLRTD